MKKKKNILQLPLNPRPCSSSFDKSIRYQLGSLLKISQQKIKKKPNTTKHSPKHQIGKSTRITSLNSCQNSELLSKKASSEKSQNRREGNGKRKQKGEKKNVNITQKTKVSQYLVKRPKNKSPRKSSKFIGKIFEFSKIADESKWRKALKNNFIFTQSSQVKNISKLDDIDEIGQIIKSIDSESHSFTKSFLHHALQNEDKRENISFNKNRIIIVDWVYLIGASLSLNRETVHLAVHYLDSYTENTKEIQKINILAAASLFLAVKQEEHEYQNSVLEIMCMSEKIQLHKNEIVEAERKILMNLNFKLKANTLPFWIDYFSLKWDKFVQRCNEASTKFPFSTTLFQLRTAEGDSYKFYRQLTELVDITVLLGQYRKYEKSKLALASLYLIIRIQLQKSKENESENLFKVYQREFMKKATPIFRDRLRLNEIFNNFLTELCQFEMTEIIPSIKFVAQFLDLNFMYEIDKKTFQESQSYEQFIRKMTYSSEMKLYSLSKLQS